MAAPTKKKRAVDEEIADVCGEDSSDYEDEQGMNDGEEGEQEEDMEGQVGTPVFAVETTGAAGVYSHGPGLVAISDSEWYPVNHSR